VQKNQNGNEQGNRNRPTDATECGKPSARSRSQRQTPDSKPEAPENEGGGQSLDGPTDAVDILVVACQGSRMNTVKSKTH